MKISWGTKQWRCKTVPFPNTALLKKQWGWGKFDRLDSIFLSSKSGASSALYPGFILVPATLQCNLEAASSCHWDIGDVPISSPLACSTHCTATPGSQCSRTHWHIITAPHGSTLPQSHCNLHSLWTYWKKLIGRKEKEYLQVIWLFFLLTFYKCYTTLLPTW